MTSVRDEEKKKNLLFLHPSDCPALNTINGVLFIFSRWNLIFLLVKKSFFVLPFISFHQVWESKLSILSFRVYAFVILFRCTAGISSGFGWGGGSRVEGEIKKHSARQLIDCEKRKMLKSFSMLQPKFLRWTLWNRLFVCREKNCLFAGASNSKFTERKNSSRLFLIQFWTSFA